MSIEHSRAVLLGAHATGLTTQNLETRLENALTVVRVDPRTPSGHLTARVLLTTLRRLPGRIQLDCTGLSHPAAQALLAAAAAIDPTRPVELVRVSGPHRSVKLHIGPSAEREWIRILPDGYGAQLATHTNAPLKLHQPGNALGAVFAAAAGAAESFKYTAGVLDDRCTKHESFAFCPLTLSDDLSRAPANLRTASLNLALVGNGAIGTAEALILAELALGGRIVVCDPERFDPENRGTYSVGGWTEAIARPFKTDLVAAVLRARGYTVLTVPARSVEMIRMIEGRELADPSLALTALDSAEARRETQALWSDTIIDAQTGDTALGMCVSKPEGPCLRCFYPERRSGPSALDRLAEATGLPKDLLARGDHELSADDIAFLEQDKQDRLRPHLGKPVCGLANAVGLTDADDAGYRPSVPFVSQLAACLAIGKLVRVQAGVDLGPNWMQFDALHGPIAPAERWAPRADCSCQTRADLIQVVRARRVGR